MQEPSTPTIHHHSTATTLQEKTAAHLQAFKNAWVQNPNLTHERWLHRDHQEQRDATLKALIAAEAPDNLIARFTNCGRFLWLYRHNVTNTIAHRVSHCGLRYCPHCQPRRACLVPRVILSNLPPAQHRLSFLTLTQRAIQGESPSNAYRRLLSAFKRLRLSNTWKAYVHAGIYVLETTYNAESQWFHVHVHAIIDARFIPLNELTAAWHKAARDTANFHLVAIPDMASIARYLSSYLSKTIHPSLYQHPEALTEFIKTMHHKPLIRVIGKWKGLALWTTTQKTRSVVNQTHLTQRSAWTFLGELTGLITMAMHGCQHAAKILNQTGFGTIPLDCLPLTLAKRTPISPRSPPKKQLTLLPMQ